MSGTTADAAVAILHATQPEESILLIRRAINPRDPWSGHWSFPGGRREPGDTDLVETALRELTEECSIVLTRAQLDVALPVMPAGQRVGRHVHVAPFAFRVESQLPVTLHSREAADSLWAPTRTLTDLEAHRWIPIPGLPQEMRFPAVELKGTPLWGFTYRVLCRWLGIETPDPQP